MSRKMTTQWEAPPHIVSPRYRELYGHLCDEMFAKKMAVTFADRLMIEAVCEAYQNSDQLRETALAAYVTDDHKTHVNALRAARYETTAARTALTAIGLIGRDMSATQSKRAVAGASVRGPASRWDDILTPQ